MMPSDERKAILRGGPLDGTLKPIPTFGYRWSDFQNPKPTPPKGPMYLRTGRFEGDYEVFEYADG